MIQLTSIVKKQIVAVTGLALILFILGHLAGNLLIFLGPDAYNAYAKKLAGLRPGLLIVEFGLLFVFLVHIWLTALLVIENIRARGSVRYSVNQAVGKRSLATRLMPYTGTYILLFIVAHLLDFTFIDHHGPRSVLMGKELGVYGVVYNAFSDPLHSLFYIIAMGCLGLHLSHGIQSVAQSFGLADSIKNSRLIVAGKWLGFLIALAYSSIPVYILLS